MSEMVEGYLLCCKLFIPCVSFSFRETKPALANPNKSKSKKKLPSTPGSKASSKTKPTQIVKPGSGHPKGSPWGDMATSPPALSLSDVMAEEERLMEKRNTSCPTQVTAQPRQAKESKLVLDLCVVYCWNVNSNL